jgi:hypothetical protein
VADLVRRRVAVIATPGSPGAALAAKAVTTTIPIVFATGADVLLGLVASFNGPGGNVTGIGYMNVQLGSKQVGPLPLPRAARFALLVNPSQATSEPFVERCRQPWRAGGLMSYGSNVADQFRQAGIYAARILKGKKAAKLPVVQPTKFEFPNQNRTGGPFVAEGARRPPASRSPKTQLALLLAGTLLVHQITAASANDSTVGVGSANVRAPLWAGSGFSVPLWSGTGFSVPVWSYSVPRPLWDGSGVPAVPHIESKTWMQGLPLSDSQVEALWGFKMDTAGPFLVQSDIPGSKFSSEPKMLEPRIWTE